MKSHLKLTLVGCTLDFSVPILKTYIKLKLSLLVFAIGGIFKTPQSNREMRAAILLAGRWPALQVQKVQKIQIFQKIPGVYC